MATIVLSTLGTMAAGPIGGLLGTLVGGAIDQQLIGGGVRKGPRLGDLTVQSSTYGSAIPRVHGTMRVAGTVVWATDLKESRELQGDGKSAPETVVYLYSASFAVALSSRPASRLGRIWADGKLLRGAAGDLKVGGTLRFLDGSEDQAIDPLLGSIEGIDSTPAYRGLALAVFEDLELATYGNRLPNLTFELIGDSERPTAGEILTDSSGGLIASSDPRPVDGYAAHGDDIGSALRPLIDALGIDLDDRDGRLVEPERLAYAVAAEELGVAPDGAEGPSSERQRAPAETLPTAISLTYYEPARDYQSGSVRAAMAARHRAERPLAVPIVADAASAAGLAEAMLRREWIRRDRLRLRLPPAYFGLAPGDVLAVPELGTWVADRVGLEDGVVIVEAVAATGSIVAKPSDPGRPVSEPDVVAEPTFLVVLDVPEPDGGASSEPSLRIAATSPNGGYRPVAIETSVGGLVGSLSSAPAEAVAGSVVGRLPGGPEAVLDLESSVEVVLANAEHWLQSCEEEALLNGANLAAVGDELIQYATADPLGAGRFRLSRLARGRGGTEWAIGSHQPGEGFVRIEPGTLATLRLSASQLGAAVTFRPLGVGNAGAGAIARTATGEGTRPLSPAHLECRATANGGAQLSWVARSRAGWAWSEGIATAPDPDFQGFRVTCEGGTMVEVVTSEPFLELSAEDRAALGPTWTATVRQASSLTLSRPAILFVSNL